MDHSYIEENGLIDLYHQGALSPEEETRFEAHLIDCALCIEELEAARGFRDGLRTMVAQDAAKTKAAAEIGTLASLAAILRRPQGAALLLGTMAIAMVSVFWFAGELGHHRSAAHQAHIDVEQWRQRFERQQGQVTHLEQQLAENQFSSGLEDSQLNRLARPQWDTDLHILSAVRSSTPAVIDLPAAGEWLALAVHVDLDPSIESYRVTISGGPDQVSWQRDELLPNALETLIVTFPASYFQAGEYRLSLDGLRIGQGQVEIDNFAFQVIDQN